MTPEGRVKQRIKKVLDVYKGSIYYYMPVPAGFGKQTLDYLGFFHGRGFAVEAKRPGKEPTPRQDKDIEDIQSSGATVFVISNDDTLMDLTEWLAAVEAARV